jgi:hypothetical protein
LFFLISVAIIFPTTFALVVVHGPKMAAFLASSVRGGSKNSKQGSMEKERERSTAPKSHHGGPQHHHLASADISHTVRLLRTLEEGKEKNKDKNQDERSVLVEDADQGLTSSGHGIQLPALDEPESTKPISIKSKERDVPSLAPTWKILTPSVSAKPHPHTPQRAGSAGDHSDRDIEESPALTSSRNPLFEEPAPQDL